MSPTVIGIDLGSANVRCGRAEYQDLRQPIIVPIGNSFEGIPTAFTITEPNYTHQIGADALDNYPSNVIFDSARVLSPSDMASKNDRANIYAELHEHHNWKEQYYGIRTGEKEYKLSVPEVIGGILNAVKMMAQTELGCPIQRAVLTVPSMAGTAHRRMLQQQASKIAGFKVKLINQSTAAALALRLHTGGRVEGTVLVFSMGARTIECSIFEFANGQTPKLCHSDGFFHFGGESFTNRLLDFFMDHLSKNCKEKFAKLRKRWAKDPEGEKVAKCKLRKEAEKAKAALMDLEETSILLELDIEFGSCKINLNRDNFKEICSNLRDKMEILMVNVLNFCPKGKTIGHVMLAGASSKLFIVSELLKGYLPRATFIKMDAVPPGLAAARGAAIGAALWEAKSGIKKVPECLKRLDMPDFAYRRLEAKQIRPMNCFRLTPVDKHLIAEVGMEVPTKPVSIISSRGNDNPIKLYDVFGGSERDQFAQKIGQCNLHGSESIYFSLDENGLAVVTRHPFQWIWQRNLLTGDKLERARQEMCKYNERIRKETEEAKRKGDEESRRMLERMKKEEEEEEEKRRKEMEEKRMKEEKEEKKRKRNKELEEQKMSKETREEEEEIETVKVPKNPPMNSPSHQQLIPLPFEYTFSWPTKPPRIYLLGSWYGGENKIECQLKWHQGPYDNGSFNWSYGTTVFLNPGKLHINSALIVRFILTRGGFMFKLTELINSSIHRRQIRVIPAQLALATIALAIILEVKFENNDVYGCILNF